MGYSAFVLYYHVKEQAKYPAPQEDVASFGTEHMGYAKYELPKPGTLVLVYPVITMGEKTHEGSRKNHLGKDATQEQK